MDGIAVKPVQPAQPIRRGRPALALKLVAGHGVPRHGLLRVPPEGCGMARAFALDEASFDAGRGWAADRCRIAMRGESWVLSNHSRRMVCTLNGRRVALREEAIVHVDDILELGLLRFIVVDPDRRGAPDPLDRLDIDRGPSRQAPSTMPAKDAAGDLLDRLHEEFVAAASDPLQLGGPVEWQRPGPRFADGAPTLDELREQAAPFRLMRDVLLPRVGIDALIDGLDAFGADDPAQLPSRVDVLQLFAPDLHSAASAWLPGLTRREHHAVSIDSAMSIGTVRPGDDRADR